MQERSAEYDGKKTKRPFGTILAKLTKQKKKYA